MNKLLILGNGFDLLCGLKSKYSDFFDYRYKDLKSDFHFDIYNEMENKDIIDIINQLQTELNINNLTLWDLFFLSLSKSNFNWQNIEEIIGYTLEDFPEYKESDSAESINASTYENFSPNPKKDQKSYKDMIKNHMNNKHVEANYTLYATLLDQLKAFEKIFAKYISDQMSSSDNYKENAAILLRYFVADANIVDVLSFNYSLTKYFGNSKLGNRLKSWQNIHGVVQHEDRLFSPPIFGIDHHDSDSPEDPKILFTKEYRLLTTDARVLESIDSYSMIDEIVVVGHSLGHADYSYFESIFDICNLYNSDTKVTFYYYEGEEPIESKREYGLSVTNLMFDYGTTLDNNHGNNITQKMLLENRLRIIPYPEDLIKKLIL
ncbi:AbiH family protein [Ligilactobacillus equi]